MSGRIPVASCQMVTVLRRPECGVAGPSVMTNSQDVPSTVSRVTGKHRGRWLVYISARIHLSNLRVRFLAFP